MPPRSGPFTPTIAALVILTLALCAWAYATPVWAAMAPTARVISVDRPQTVLPKQEFQVVITDEFSGKFLADIGILDQHAGRVVQSFTLISSFTEEGRMNFTFQLEAPANAGEWRLVAVTRIWWQDAWYQASGGTIEFAVNVSDTFTLTLRSQLSGMNVSVDGTPHALEQGQTTTLPLKLGYHNLETASVIQSGPGKRYVFSGWSDGVQSNPRTLFLGTDSSITALYRVQYYLSTTSESAKTYGEGWYDEGSRASFAADPSYFQLSWPITYRYSFSEWSGDASPRDFVSSVLMDGPKTVHAEYVSSADGVDLEAVGYVLLVASIPLAARFAYLRTRKTHGGPRSRSAMSLRRFELSAFVLAILAVSLFFAPVAAQLPVKPDASIVHIGDADWYYWNRSNADTCIIWLGGGISQETVIGYNYYWVNPFDYESFGTIRFVQDLADHYCVIGLEKGSYKLYNPAADRTIYQELYNIDSKILSQLHGWVQAQGYRHTFLVGYSVGGQAVTMEVSLRDPSGWTGADGVVLMTVPFQNMYIQHAHALNANLLLLYGGDLPDFVATAQQFYDNAPPEGPHGEYYLHKEIHVVRDVGHELWTIRSNGEYTLSAANIIASFIEKSKALQFQPQSAGGGLSSQIISVQAPQSVKPQEIFTVQANFSSSNATQEFAAIIYDETSKQAISSAPAAWNGQTWTARLLVPSNPNSTTLSLAVTVLQKWEDKWLPDSTPYTINIPVSNSIELAINSGIPDLEVAFDGTLQHASAFGIVRMETSQGKHTIQVPAIIELGNFTRLVFSQWDDSTAAPTRTVQLENDLELTAVYKKQNYVLVSSPFGITEGTGWYDENSIVTVRVTPPLITQAGVSFSHWEGTSDSKTPSILFFVDSPKSLQAVWSKMEAQGPGSSGGLVFVLSVLVFIILLLLNLRTKLSKAKQSGA